jgi:anti-anti-sigma factor
MVLSVSGRRLVNRDDTCGVLAVAGEIDVATYPALRTALDDLHKGGFCRIIVDLSEVTYCDSTGIGVLAMYAKRLLDAGGRLEVTGLRPDVAEIFTIAGLTAVVPAFATVELALASEPPPDDTHGT